jgi:nucleotide-binding universal stress UspA family protein
MSVVAVLQGTEEQDRQSTLTAVELARRLNTPVTGLFALPDPNAVLMVAATPEASGLTASTAQSIIDLQLALKQTAETAFHDATSGGAHGLACDFFHEVNTVERASANAATLAQAVVFPRSAAKGSAPLNLAFEHVMMEARLPVVLAGTDEFKDGGPVIIAWDGSNGAARAVRFHLPLIRALGHVVIAQAPKDLERDAARPVAEPGTLESWLKRNGIKAEVAEIDGDVASGLLALAKGCGACMIVAGAYGHSRLGERLFGGTTRRLLEAAHAPVLALAR